MSSVTACRVLSNLQKKHVSMSVWICLHVYKVFWEDTRSGKQSLPPECGRLTDLFIFFIWPD